MCTATPLLLLSDCTYMYIHVHVTKITVTIIPRVFIPSYTSLLLVMYSALCKSIITYVPHRRCRIVYLCHFLDVVGLFISVTSWSKHSLTSIQGWVSCSHWEREEGWWVLISGVLTSCGGEIMY